MNAPLLFEVGRRYRAKQSFGSGGSAFVGGGAYEFERDGGYSRYDGCYLYRFKDLAGGRTVYWWLSDGVSCPQQDWQEFFEAVER